MILSGEMVTVEFYAISVVLFLAVGVAIGHRAGLEGKKVLEYERTMDSEESK